MEDNGVAPDGEAAGMALHLDHLQHLGGYLQFDGANVDGVFVAVAKGQHGLALFVVAQHRGLDRGTPAGKREEHAKTVGLGGINT